MDNHPHPSRVTVTGPLALDHEGEHLPAAPAPCPDCGNPWNMRAHPFACPTCGLTLDDLEAAADFLDGMEKR